MLDVHVTAPFKLIQAVTPLMREAAKQEQAQQGQAAPRSIINISSTSGTHGNAGQANYAAGKAAIVGLTKVGTWQMRCCWLFVRVSVSTAVHVHVSPAACWSR
jgi:3-oxoacyl-[acyl-carrier protein] reductase